MTTDRRAYFVGSDRIPVDNMAQAVLQAASMLSKDNLGSSVPIYAAKKKDVVKGRV